MSKPNDDNLVQQLRQKSREAFVMSLEVFNKPTLKYRVEGFVFFVCNAWELMLKAEIIKRDDIEAIYYKDNIRITKNEPLVCQTRLKGFSPTRKILSGKT